MVALEAETEPASLEAEAKATAVEPEAESIVMATVVVLVTSFTLNPAGATAAHRIVTFVCETDVTANKREDGQSKGRPGNAFHV
jgi:hypothetical protein